LDGQDPMLFLALVIEIFTIYFLAPWIYHKFL